MSNLLIDFQSLNLLLEQSELTSNSMAAVIMRNTEENFLNIWKKWLVIS